MVHWNELSDLIKSNPFQTYSVKSLELVIPERKGLSHFPILWDVSTSSGTDTSAGADADTNINIHDNHYSIAPPIVNTVAHVGPVNAGPTVTPVVPVAPTPPPKQLKSLPPTKLIVDPIVLGIEFSDLLYEAAPKTVKREMEIKEAIMCESRIDELYKSQGGRSRGWTKAMLEAAIRPRCASGGNLYELKGSRSVFLWQMLTSDKATSGFLDFLCVVKQIQVAVWNEENRTIVLYPAADYIGDGVAGVAGVRGLYNIDTEGHILKSGTAVRTGKDLVQFATRYSWTLLPPSSVIHSLEKLTLNDLETVGKKLGMAQVVGTKVERIAAIAGFKLKSRLGAV